MICQILGKLHLSEKLNTPFTKILCDTGASLDCVSFSFYKKYLQHCNLRSSGNQYAFDASSRQLKIHGELTTDVLLPGQDEDIKIKAAKFAVLEPLSQDIILGCNTLSGLGFQVSKDKVYLKDIAFDRLKSESLEVTNIDIGIELKVINAIITISPDNQIITTCEAEPVGHLSADVRPGLYPMKIEGSAAEQFGVSQKFISDHQFHSPLLQIQRHELQMSWKLHFRDALTEVPENLICAFLSPPSVRQHTVNKIEANRPGLTEEQYKKMMNNTILPKENLQKLLKKNGHIFASNDLDLGRYFKPVSLRLRDPTAIPPYAKPRVVPHRLRPWLDSKLLEMTNQGLISLAADSPFCAPVQIVKKKEANKFRLTIDYRLLNKQLVQNRWPIPRITEVLEELSGSKYYSTMDARSGFWQLPLEEKSRQMTSFAARGRMYKWNFLPMGLSVSPGIFQHAMMDALGDDVFKCVIVYIDDLVVYNSTIEEHLTALARIFNKLWSAGIRLHPEKSFFGQKSVDFLGYSVSQEGYVPLKSKVESILMMDKPTNRTSLKSFIGSLAFYTTSLPMLQVILGPLHEISGTKKAFVWTDRQEEAYNEAKQILASVGPLALPNKDNELPLFLTTDASSTGYGSILSEKQADGTERPLGYYPGSFRDAQLNWPIREQELYSFYAALIFFYPQLMARTFCWRTDNKALSTLATNTDIKFKASGVPNPRVIRWLEYIVQFDFNIELVKGDSPQMGLTDCLSRFKKKSEKEQLTPSILNLVTKELVKLPYFTTTGCTFSDFITAQINDPDLVNRTGVWARYTKGRRKARFRTNNDGIREIARHKSEAFRAMVPKQLIPSILDFHHVKSHDGEMKMRAEITKTMFIPKLQQHIRDYLNACAKCVSINSRPSTARQPIKTSTSRHPWSTVQMDLAGPMEKTLAGNQYILGIICDNTGWLELRPIKDKQASTVLEAVNDIIVSRGPPLCCQTDNGLEFTNQKLQHYFSSLGIHWQKICPYKPTSNGRIENANKKVKRQLRLLEVPPLMWDAYLGHVQLAINLSRQTGGYSSWQLMHGWLLHKPGFFKNEFNEEVQQEYRQSEDEWAKNQITKMARLIADRFLAREEKKRAEFEQLAPPPEKLKEGSRVLVHFPYIKRSKLFSPWKGIYKIVEILDKNCYVIQEETEERKKFIVDRRRIRLLGPKLTIEDLEVMGPVEETELESIEDIQSHPILEDTVVTREAESNFMMNNPELDPVLTESVDKEQTVPGETSSPRDVTESGPNLKASELQELERDNPEEVPVILEEIADQTAKAQGLQYETTGRDCQIEFEIPDKTLPHPEDDRPKRKAAIRAKSKIRGWTKQLLNN